MKFLEGEEVAISPNINLEHVLDRVALSPTPPPLHRRCSPLATPGRVAAFLKALQGVGGACQQDDECRAWTATAAAV
jgi:hypothetical protein